MRVEVEIGATPSYRDTMLSPTKTRNVSPETVALDGKARPFIPENPSECQLIQSLFMDEESADVVIQVGDKPTEHLAFDAQQFILGHLGQLTSLCGSNEADIKLVASHDEELISTVPQTKIAPATFYAHRFILKRCSKPLFEMAGAAGYPTSPIQISSLSPQIFRYVLFYMYGGKIARNDMKAHSKDIINAADLFAVLPLKVEAEACFVETTTFTVGNVMEHLLYADSKNCALLKEAALDFIIAHKTEVLEKDAGHLKEAPGGILADILGAVARVEQKNSKNGSDPFSTMRVSDLRMKVHEKGLDVDGSREMLIAALK